MTINTLNDKLINDFNLNVKDKYFLVSYHSRFHFKLNDILFFQDLILDSYSTNLCESYIGVYYCIYNITQNKLIKKLHFDNTISLENLNKNFKNWFKEI